MGSAELASLFDQWAYICTYSRVCPDDKMPAGSLIVWKTAVPWDNRGAPSPECTRETTQRVATQASATSMWLKKVAACHRGPGYTGDGGSQEAVARKGREPCRSCTPPARLCQLRYDLEEANPTTKHEMIHETTQIVWFPFSRLMLRDASSPGAVVRKPRRGRKSRRSCV